MSAPYGTGEFDRLVSALDADASHPHQIGRYRILELIGEGGMGAVYMAEQRSPIERIVALKLIKLGMDSRHIISRFESERQALAWMDHPNVAKVLDAGTDPVSGRPYFVMEYVAGQPITRFCDDHQLTIRQRLELFIQVCDAIAHAHQKMIVHRDVKPSNILVTSSNGEEHALVKVIDFGIAKALVAQGTQSTMVTESGQLIGTPEYMSPEQTRSDGAADVDTRSDIYSLGVVLYELLSGTLPFDSQALRSSGVAGMERIICEMDPPPPSTRLSMLGSTAIRIAQRRHAALGELSRQLKGELGWIPLKAMRKDRAQRYATVAQFAHDIQNYLEHRPLLAGPESRSYRLRKFLHRNKVSVVATAAVAASLIIGIVVSSILAVRLKHTADSLRTALRGAETANASAQAVNEFLTSDVLSGASPDRLADKTIRDAIVKTMLEPAAAALTTRFNDKPLIEAAVRQSLALTYNAIGHPDRGAEYARAALETRRQLLGEDQAETLKSTTLLGRSLQLQGKLSEAEILHRKAVEGCRHNLGADHPQTLDSISQLITCLTSLQKLQEAELLCRDALDRRRRLLGEDDPLTLSLVAELAYIVEDQGNLADAEPLSRKALAGMQRTFGDDHLQTITYMNNLGVLLQKRGKFDEAEPLHSEVLEGRRRILGIDHPETIQSINNMAGVLMAQGKLPEAERSFTEALERYRRVLGADHPDTILITNNVADALLQQGKFSQAEPYFRDALERMRRVLGEDHPQTLSTLDNLAALLTQWGRLGDAEPLSSDALARMRRVLGDEHPQTLMSFNTRVGLLLLLKRYTEAESLAWGVLENMRRVFGDDHYYTLAMLNNLVFSLEAQGKLTKALPLAEELYRRCEGAPLPPQPAALFASRYGPILASLGKYHEAEEPLRREYELLQTAGLNRDPRVRVVVESLIEVFDQSSRPDGAAAWREKLSALEASTKPATTPATQN